MLNKRYIDTYIEERNLVVGEDKYKMYVHYNGVEPCFLFNNYDAAVFASYFKRKMFGRTNGALYSDYYGLKQERANHDSVLYTVTGIDNILNALIELEVTCKNLDIQSDLTVHLHNKDYPLVRDADNEYINGDFANGKGTSMHVLKDLYMDINLLKEEKNNCIKKRR